MRAHHCIMTLTALSVLTGVAGAQNIGDFNGGFETPDGGDQADVAFWREFNGARRRTAGDGLNPPAIIRSGVASIELPPNPSQPFVGADTNEFRIDIFGLNDPAYVYGCGPGVYSAWYAIPASAPLDGIGAGGQSAGLKLEFRRANSSIYFAFEDLSIDGDTGGQWQQASLTITEADWQAVFDEFNNGVPYEDFPIATSLLVVRFGDSSDTGVIFFDDAEWTELEYDPADLTEDGTSNGLRDGTVTLSDFAFYLSLWALSDPLADVTLDGACDFGNGGDGVTLSDFSCYLSQWSTASESVEPSCF